MKRNVRSGEMPRETSCWPMHNWQCQRPPRHCRENVRVSFLASPSPSGSRAGRPAYLWDAECLPDLWVACYFPATQVWPQTHIATPPVPPAPFPHHLHHPLPSTCMCVPPGAPDSGRTPTNPFSQTHFFPLACVDLPAVEVAPCIAPPNHNARRLIAFVDELCKRRSPHSLAAQVSPHPVYCFPFIVLLKLLSCPVRQLENSSLRWSVTNKL